jgi:hypothetical protein
VGQGVAKDSSSDSLCVWRAEGRPGEVAVLVGSAHSASDFESRVADVPASFGAATPVTISGASKAVEFGDFGTVVMIVNGRLVQVQQLLGTSVSPTVHRDLATSVAAHS